MLVMRNFGYFGLHTVIDNKSSLARDRVVDFTGELQIRRKVEEDINERHPRTKPEQGEGYKMILPDFRPEYICEPSKNGGRHLEKPDSKVPLLSASKLYAQELLPLPLQMSPSSRLPSGISPGMVRGQSSQDDIEPYFHTSFCNELLCLPRILHNCSKMNVVVKVELREVEWSDENIGYLAHLPSCGPSVHNNRRGPFLVQSSFTSCTSRRSHQFMDEFKVKLPLDLKRDGAARNLSLFFTIFKIKLGGRSRWKRNAKLLFGSDTTSVTEEHAVSGSTQLDQIACGFLPLTEQSCIVENGIHDVPCAYKAFPLTEEMCTKGYGECTTYLLKERTDDMLAGTASHARDDSCAEDATVSESSYVSELRGTPVSNLVTHEGGQDLATLDEDSQMRHQKTKDNINEQISMSVSLYFSFFIFYETITH